MGTRGALFREIHKNTWLKKASIEAKKLPAGNKKIEKFWVVFCVHDDCEALLEGYIEPRQAASHNPDWTISLQTVQHISHALVPNEQDYEFVIALNNDVARFLAPTWECMQEWVEALRFKLREMKILSPKENIYSKLPEIRPPLLPTRDPTSPLPAPPPVPAAIVPGIERIVTTANITTFTSTSSSNRNILNTTVTTDPPIAANTAASSIINSSTATSSSVQPSSLPSSSTPLANSSTQSYAVSNNTPTTSTFSTAMSNTSSQNLMNLLTNPIPAYNYNNVLNDSIDSDLESPTSSPSIQFDSIVENSTHMTDKTIPPVNDIENKLNHLTDSPITSPSISKIHTVNLPPISLAKTFTNNVLSDPNTCPNQTKPNDKITVDIQNSSPPSTIGASFIDDDDTGINVIDSGPTTPAKLPIMIPRPHTSRTLSDPKLRKVSTHNNNNNQKPSSNSASTSINVPDTPTSTNITIIQVSNSRTAEVFNFEITDTNDSLDTNFKSNVQVIPSNDPSTPTHTLSSESNNNNNMKSILALSNKSNDFHKITTNISTEENQIIQVKVPNSSTPGYGKIIPKTFNDAQKIVLTTNDTTVPSTSAITNISVNNTNSNHQSYYEQVFLMPSSSSSSIPEPGPSSDINILGSQISESVKSKISLSLNNSKHQRSASHNELEINRLKLKNSTQNAVDTAHSIVNGNNKEMRTNNVPYDNITTTSSSSIDNTVTTNRPTNTYVTNIRNESRIDLSKKNSLITSGRGAAIFTRGLTEAAITRPSRSDKNLAYRTRSKQIPSSATDVDNNQINSENNNTPETQDQRKRSSSTSEAQSSRHRSANNSMNNESRRLQSPPQPLRSADNNPQSTGRLTLKEQQVLQLRRQMMHPTGVRIKLRRKDCIGSIAIIDAFGAVWVAGWNQNDHPVLYNALHIGDQLISVGGVATSTASETHKLIRSSPGLYVELIVRRVPFGRVYAIRREMEGQCLGLIRDGNTATIVDVVPNSLAARHGLPPKTQSCDGLSLTFWVLTEINGRPLNLFFKENEIKDRLNAVGRDISILVQPLDLVMKLKKQLKSLRGYKHYIVQ